MNSAHCSKCVCVCVCVRTAPSICALGWVKCREHISLLVIINYICTYIIVYVTKKKKDFFFFFDNGKIQNIGKPIYRSISNQNTSYGLMLGTHHKIIGLILSRFLMSRLSWWI